MGGHQRQKARKSPPGVRSSAEGKEGLLPKPGPGELIPSGEQGGGREREGCGWGRPGLRSVAWHAEDEARAVLGEVWLGLVEPRLHGHGALLPVKAALHRVSDVDLKVALLTLEMICQHSNKFSNSILIGWLFAEEADNEVFVVFCVEHYKLVFSIGDT